MSLSILFGGAEIQVPAGEAFTLGRDATLTVDDNPFLHRRFLALEQQAGVWIMANVGSRLSATVSDHDGRLEAFLGPGGVLPIVFEQTVVRFSAGPTSYEFQLNHRSPPFRPSPVDEFNEQHGDTTGGHAAMTADQKLLVLSLAESALRSGGGAAAMLPTSPQAARRLGWTTTKFNRKLDNVCGKLDRLGVRGLLGDVASSASNRRARLVEYTLAVRLVTREDLALLDEEPL